MSGDQPYRSADDEIKDPKFINEQTHNSGQSSIDQRLKRLREEILPFYPFLLTVPTDVPFRLGSRFVNNWAVGNDGPFTPEEQQLQYMTFLTHHEGDSLLVAVGDWSDATGNVMSDQRSGGQSAASTPSNNSVKKKITFNDYRNRRKSGASASPVGPEVSKQSTSVLDTPEASQRAARASLPSNDSQKPAGKPPVQSRAASNSGGIERKRPFVDGTSDSSRSQHKVAAPKKPRISPSPAKTERLKGNGLPALLSPTLPPTSNSPRLPRLLSPTLPPDIEKELAGLGEGPLGLGSSQSDGASNNDLSSGSKIQKAKSAVHASSQPDSTHSSGLHSKQFYHGNDKRRPSSTDVSTLDNSLASKGNPKNHVGNTMSRSIGSPPVLQDASARAQLVVKLKYGRSNRKRIEALLKFSGKKKPAPPGSPVKSALDIEPSQTQKARQAAAKAPASEHPDHNKPQRLEGKGKHMGTITVSREHSKVPEKPQTPMSFSSNLAVNPSDRSKASSTTPVKDPKSSASRFDPYSGNDGKPSSHPAVKRPGNSATPTKLASPQSTNTASRQCDRRAWKDEYQKYSNLGRDLKHAAERHTAKDHVTTVDEKLAAATAIEAILCFIVAFVADDQSKALSRQTADSSSWLSILAYWRVVKKNSTPYPRLHSLCLILGAVSYDAIHALDLERLAATPLPGENTPAPTPGSDENPAASEDHKKSRKEFVELKNRPHECYRESQKLWLEGSRGLCEDVLSREFPSTWSKRSKNFSELGRQRLRAGDYSGEFFLPVGRTNTPLEVVRFSHAFLSEWCAKEGVGWNSRLKL
ncbi:uncharacterized protein AKAW2_11264A [Aspergillus luchuensis]|uniref:Similar to An07g10310 n=1 Tax=Aspergillus kawachii TaxID=1069201 RepID=A0A146F3N0_ASPKA|nr:uncharacterized protein AKAW2_11264A [Aspergillus luchuensis]BCR94218.1 hypothetical protein AKAW2_11264A [Aspergillus luchuensis]BCS06828.1 hypothetical protein ALUC_11209A [Aspergillus luchuensis]GAT20311.1 similar to An07g10310 [Aspergillus luchuensis]